MADETMSDDKEMDLLFMQLVMMFQGMAMQQLGKVMNPMTQQIDSDLGQAKNFIDLLGMVEKKTQGNLGEGEAKLLQRALFDLRMNYVDELKKENVPDPEETSAPEVEASRTESEDASSADEDKSE
jgi:hypothetical protein